MGLRSWNKRVYRMRSIQPSPEISVGQIRRSDGPSPLWLVLFLYEWIILVERLFGRVRV